MEVCPDEKDVGMGRTLTVTLGLALSVAMAQPAWAVPVTPTDLASVALGAPVGGVMIDDFTTVDPPPPGMGDATTRVFFDGMRYVYTQTVFPNVGLNFVFNTEFDVSGFTGLAGWRYSDAAATGAGGNPLDFHIERNDAGRLIYIAMFGGAFGEWNAFEPITFFFASTLPPTIKGYGLFSLNPVELGSALGFAPEGLAPVPEPGSIALFGSGLVALYAAVRRRRSLKM
jgi:hypothetical protein